MKTLDLAQLYLRITIGGMLLLHNISKYQSYNLEISQYHNLDGLSAQFWFVFFTAIESITALMLIIGLKVRLAAFVLTIGTILYLTLYFPHAAGYELELQAIYIFIYLYILISGGGIYSYDMLLRHNSKRNIEGA